MNKGRYKKQKTILGEGTYKTVTKAIDEEEGKEVAYNEVKMRPYEIEGASFSKEIALLKNIDHANIIKIFDYWFTDDEFVFITELMTGGTLRDYIQKVGPLNAKLIRKWGRQILEGLKYLHTLDPPIIHRDIKNENIFVNSSQGELKIGDLGIAREKKHKRYTIVGTPHFMAREMLEGEGYSEKVDIYAFGMCLIEMATGRTPYNEYHENTDVYKNILQGVLPQALHQVTDSCLKSLIMGCLVPHANRYSASQCMDHHFFHTDVVCDGDCLPKDCVSIYPFNNIPVKNMELSLISFNENVLTFQILLVETLRFIKFDYDLESDTLEKVSKELENENIIDAESIEAFMKLLETGIETAKLKKESGLIRDGIVELSSQEASAITDSFKISKCSSYKQTEFNKQSDSKFVESNKQSESKFVESNRQGEVKFGENTLEELKEMEEEMKAVEKKKEIERRRDEEMTMRLKAKLEHKNASYDCTSLVSNNISNSSPTITANNNTANNNTANNNTSINNTPYNTSINNTPYTTSINNTANNVNFISSNSGDEYENYQPTNDNFRIFSPPINSPPFASSKIPDDVNDAELNESYEICKAKYRTNYTVAQFSMDAAAITGRTEDTAKSWIKALKDEDFESVFDLKLIVFEDWEKLPLTVFSCRAMQNMLYGIDNIPLKEKQLAINPKMKDYDNKLPIKDFLEDVCTTINRKEIVPNWENKLMAQDIRTVGELKSLHQDDWNRLGLSVFAYRMLKNVIFRKGKIVID